MRGARLIATVVAAGIGCAEDGGVGETLAGRILGEPFLPTEVAFVGPLGEDACSFQFGGQQVTFGSTAVVLGFARSAGLCAQATDPCAGVPSLELAIGTVMRVQLGGGAPPLGTGRFAVYGSLAEAYVAAPDAYGQLAVGIMVAAQTDAACSPAPDPPGASGSLWIDSLTGSQLVGRIDVTFADGGFLRGPFTAAVCGALPSEGTVDVCMAPLPACSGVPACG